jgi:signal transduction histidine kinase
MGHYEKVIDETLVLSRQNNDREARAKMGAVLGEYSELNQKIATLMTINRAGANEAIARIRLLRRVDTIGMWATGMAALLTLFVLGRLGVNRIASYEEQLVDYSRRLEGRNRELDAFAGRIAHDLRNPVASLTLSVDLLSRRAASEEVPAFDRMRRSIKRISTMIDDLLAFARADVPPDGAACNPAVVAAKIRDDFTERFGDAARLHEIVEPASVGYNEGLLRQVLWNLVENGVKYRRDDVHADIGIFGRVVGVRYELQVSDNGLGMLPEEARRAFDPFYRGQRVQDVSGTGLGLSIVRRIVEGGGGSVLVKTQLGSGTTFVLQLPLAGSQDKALH